MKKCRPIPAIALVGMLIVASCTRPEHTCSCAIKNHGSVTTTKTIYKKSISKVEQKCEDEKKFHEEQHREYSGVIVECKVD